MLKIEGLTKQYKNSNKIAVKNLSLELKEGEIFGFLGRNGAGKSTTIKCTVGILPFKEGTITIDGFNIQTEASKAKSLIGYVPDNHAVYEKMTAREYVYYMGILYGVPKEVIDERSKIYFHAFSLANVMDHQIRSFSHGMKQKVSIIAAVIHNPKLWILDEPLMGLDPTAAKDIRDFIEDYTHRQGNTVFFSSHNIDMVEKFCDRVAIIKNGILLEVIELSDYIQNAEISLEEHFLNLMKD